MSALSAAASDKDGDTIKALRARVASLEALLRGEPGFYITMPRAVVEQALECLEGNISYDFHGNPYEESDELMQTAAANLRVALEQPQVEQEPVAWIERWYGSGPERGWWIVCGRDHIAHLGPAEMSGEAASKIVSAHNTSPPAQRHPLTDEQIGEIEGWFSNEFGLEAKHSIDFARAIERAVWEKSNGWSV